MSLPNLFVKVIRNKSLTLNFIDENWQKQEWRVLLLLVSGYANVLWALRALF